MTEPSSNQEMPRNETSDHQAGEEKNKSNRRRFLKRLFLLYNPIIIVVLLILITPPFLFWLTSMPGESYSGPLPPLTDQETEIRDNLHRHVHKLAGEIGNRSVWDIDGLRAAEDYIEGEFRKLGYRPVRQPFTTNLSGHRYGEVDNVAVCNIIAELPGLQRPDEIIILGAHFDTRKRSFQDNPGANDNASGIATMLELARILKGRKLERTFRFVAYVNEEWPFFRTDYMGSLVHARSCRKRGDNIVLMVTLETVGYYTDSPDSQSYPFPFGYFYPSTGNFVAFIGNVDTRDHVRFITGSFRKHTKFPSEGGCAPFWFPEVNRSDHWSYWHEGYEAMMITDMADYRYPYFETAEDTPEKLVYDRLARVVAGIGRAMDELANE
jgi:hypothetical protein